jgi:hypothetical protein
LSLSAGKLVGLVCHTVVKLHHFQSLLRALDSFLRGRSIIDQRELDIMKS